MATGHGSRLILDYLPTPLENLSSISHITSVNFDSGSGIAMLLKGPSGGLYVFGTWNDMGPDPCSLGERTLQSFNRFRISTIERLSITRYDSLACWNNEESGAYQTLLMNLHTLTTRSPSLEDRLFVTTHSNTKPIGVFN